MHPKVRKSRHLKKSLIFFNIIFVAKSDIQRGGETERKILSPLIHSTTDSNGQCSADPRPGAFLGFPCFGPSSTVFPGHKQGAAWEVQLPGLEPAPIWDPGAFKGRI